MHVRHSCRDAAPGVLSSRFRWEAPMQRMEQCELEVE